MTQQVFDMEKFQEQGYLVARDVLDPDVDLAPVFTEYEELLDRLSHMWLQRGTISDTFEGMPFNERLVQIAVATRGNYYPYIDISFTQTDVEERMPVHSGPQSSTYSEVPACWTPSSSSSAQRYIATQFSMSVSSHPRLPSRKTCLATRRSRGTRPGTRTRAS